VNFGTGATGGNVHVTSAGITATHGARTTLDQPGTGASGVANTCTGALSGYGWGQNVGYVNFGGVSISSVGKFTAAQSSPVAAVLVPALPWLDHFDCTNCNVTTDWRYCSSGGRRVVREVAGHRIFRLCTGTGTIP